MFATLVALSLTVQVAAPKDKEKDLPEAAQKELKKFEGKWKAVKVVLNDESPPMDGNDVFLTFKGRKLIITEGGKDIELFDVATLDPATTPKLLDLKCLLDMGPILKKDTVYEAIYKFDGDNLTLALYFGEGNKRPAKFESPKDSGVAVVTLKKEKE